MAPKRISDAVRRKVVRDYSKGVSKRKIAERYAISHTSVTRIVRENEAEAVQPALKREQGSAPVETKPDLERDISPEKAKKLTEIEQRIQDLEAKIAYFEARKQGKGTRA